MEHVKPLVALINPNLVFQANDLFTTGVVYMPVSLAYFAGALRVAVGDVAAVDSFGERPNQSFRKDDLVFRGLTPLEAADRIPESARVIVVYASNVTYHLSVVEIIRRSRARFPAAMIVVLENTQAVTAYSLRHVKSDFFAAGADCVLTGEAEVRGVELVRVILSGATRDQWAAVGGVWVASGGEPLFQEATAPVPDLDKMPPPAWDLFPLKNYWRLDYSHGPFSTKRYLPILTSRGCPYPCRFCVIPETTGRRWRGRSAESVADEMALMKERFGVSEFHVEDVDPTVNDERTKSVCRELIKRKLNVRWKISAGTKVETIKSVETLQLMAEAGCVYLSISPESGSARMLKLMNKPFSLSHAESMIREATRLGIRTQACFVLGFPGEEDADRELTLEMVRTISRYGIDEIAVFIVTPSPGSEIFESFSGYENYSRLTFSPDWRDDYKKLNQWRMKLYSTFMRKKLRYHPFKLMRQPFNFVLRHFETKMEMTPFRAAHQFLMQKGLAGRRVPYFP